MKPRDGRRRPPPRAAAGSRPRSARRTSSNLSPKPAAHPAVRPGAGPCRRRQAGPRGRHGPGRARAGRTSSTHGRRDVALLHRALVVVGEASRRRRRRALPEQRSQTCDPMKPAAPVTSTRRLGSSSPCLTPAHVLGIPNTMPAVARQAGLIEVWAARAWNVFNEGRPFTLVYPVLVLLAAAAVGLAPEGSLLVALAGALGLAAVLAVHPFPLRGRALLWLALALAIPLLEPGVRPRSSPARSRAGSSSRSSSGARSTTGSAPARRGRTSSASGASS